MKSTRVTLFKHNHIPFQKFLSSKYLDSFGKKFGFNQIAPLTQDPAGTDIAAINFSNGVYVAQDGTEVPIIKFAVEPRKTLCEIVGETKYLDEINDEVKQYFLSFGESTFEDYLFPAVIADDSEIISKLEFSPIKLLPPIFKDVIIPDGLEKGAYPFAEPQLGTIVTSFQVDYRINESSTLFNNRITMSRKEFILQSAVGYGLEEQIFASKAPLTTDKHIDFLQIIEDNIGGS